MYRCGICTTVTPARQQELKYSIKKPTVVKTRKHLGWHKDGSEHIEERTHHGERIVTEVKLCPKCHDYLSEAGFTHAAYKVLMAQHAKKRNVDRAAPAYRMGEPRKKLVQTFPAKKQPVLQQVDLGNGKTVSVPVEPNELPKKPKTKKQRKQAQNGSVNKPVTRGYSAPKPKTKK